MIKMTMPLAAGIFLLAISSCTARTAPKPSSPKGFAIVELFTSEGCSSCPAAERTLDELSNEYTTGLYCLEFHVDYWNRLGWKDGFSDHAYSERQEQYANLLHLNSVYTPQAVVNGADEMVGSDKAKLTESIDNCLKNDPTVRIALTAQQSGSKLSVSYSIAGAQGQVLHIALVQKQAVTNVKNGENAGRTLQHHNIVRVFKSLDVAEGKRTLLLDMPAGLSPADCILIAYTQQSTDWKVTGLATATLPDKS
jgi:hypothetical protein